MKNLTEPIKKYQLGNATDDTTRIIKVPLR